MRGIPPYLYLHVDYSGEIVKRGVELEDTRG